MTTHFAPHGDDIVCGLPSPGSRLQSVVSGLKPETVNSVSVTNDKAKVTCNRCRKSDYFKVAKGL